MQILVIIECPGAQLCNMLVVLSFLLTVAMQLGFYPILGINWQMVSMVRWHWRRAWWLVCLIVELEPFVLCQEDAVLRLAGFCGPLPRINRWLPHGVFIASGRTSGVKPLASLLFDMI